ncbi:MAG: endonuclease/exonuclease/phosphatase family protein [Candidatus Cryptobacteroides sp.]|nr:endonuclease/exonuclease/phosphatase family protein [Bacteroidales bacterium]MDD7134231.1 endonuclease/exonuclease/phosphatase family protein [Bacteroidales bacterium]MDY2774786.1 endonuclease/exonuclease/phosphatase family protein [Candidatus Cryptobacteroides sp.]
MKRSFIVAALLLLMSLSASAQKTQQNYVIGFYNLENLFDIYDDPVKNDSEFLPEGKNKWTQAKYEKKLHNMAKVIRSMADNNKRWHTILGISEIENRLVIEDLVSQPEIADANYQIVHYDSPDRRGVDVALLYKPDQFTYLDSESIPFDFNSDIDFSDTDTSYFKTRDILMVHGLIAGEHFAFYVAHLPSRVGGKGGNLRSRGAEIIYNHSREMEAKYPGIKIVAMGDMNDNPTDDSMAKYLHGQEHLENVTPTEFYSPYISMLKAGYGSLCYQGVWSIYDLELVNYNLAHAPDGGLKIQPVTKNHGKEYYGVVFKRPWMTTQKGQYKGYPFRTFSNGAFVGGYSDHYPTYIVIGK